MTLEELVRVLDALEREKVAYVLIGGGAVNAHGLLRATEDIDVTISPSPTNVERLTLGSVEATVATARMLYRLKKDTVREIDHADARALARRVALEADE